MTIEIEHFEDDGRKLVRVPLATSDRKATLYDDDYNDLVALGVLPKWKLYHNQVVVVNNKKYVGIARLIRHAGQGQRVVCLDDDPTNLRKDNLLLAPGQGKFNSRSCLVRPYKDKSIIQHVNVS